MHGTLLMKTQVSLMALFVVLLTGTIGCAPSSTPNQVKVVSDQEASDTSAKTARPRDESDEYFESGAVSELKIEIPDGEMKQLRENNKAYVRCTIRENDKVVFKSVGIKLKGAAGSFREIDDRPALTLNMDKFAKGKSKKQSFHGLDKFHLNNSVQDESYLNELLCSELFQSAGIATTRVAHARVWLNDRDLGLYVLKEGFDKKFLKRHFTDSTGILYDGGFLQDIDVDLEKDNLAERRNYKKSDNINFLDGDKESSVKYADEIEPDKLDKVMYDFGITSLVNDKAMVYKGASWKDRAYWLVPGTRRFLDQKQSAAWLGFRCAMARVGSPRGLGN